jgi:hypothetical protein
MHHNTHLKYAFRDRPCELQRQRPTDAGHAPGTDAVTLADLCWATVHGLATLMAERLLGPEDLFRPGDDTLPGRVLDALGGVPRGG